MLLVLPRRSTALTTVYLGKDYSRSELVPLYDVNGDQRIILRGGTGLFTGRIPFAWIAWPITNNGINYGSFDRRPMPKVLYPVLTLRGGDGIAGFIEQNGADVKNRECR